MSMAVLPKNSIQLNHMKQYPNLRCRETLAHVHQEPCTRMFGAILFIMKTLKINQKSIKNRMDINKLSYISPVEYNTVVKMK